MIGHEGLANLDEFIYNTWQSSHGTPYAVIGRRMQYEPVDDAVDCGPGAFVTTADPMERGFNAYYGAPGYYVDMPGTDRVIDDQYVFWGPYQSDIMSSNPWDFMFGTIGSQGVQNGVGVRDWPTQAGDYSLS